MLEAADEYKRTNPSADRDGVCRDVIRLDRGDAEELQRLSVACYQRGDYAQALEMILQALQVEPDNQVFYNLLGLIYEKLGQMDNAMRAYQQAVELDENYILAMHNMVILLQGQQRYEDVIRMCGRIIEKDAKFANAYNARGYALRMLEQYESAVADFQKAIELCPESAELYNHLGIVLNKLNRRDEAIATFQNGIVIDRTHAHLYNNLGITYKAQGHANEAIEEYQKAIAIDPEFSEALYNLANAQRDIGRYSEAIATYQRAVSADPSCYQGRWNQSLVYLLTGDLTNGWRGYQWRKKPELGVVTYPHFPRGPMWEGQDFKGKTLFVHYEQGYGDIIQFMRYLPFVKQRGGRIISEMPRPLHGLVEGLHCVDALYGVLDDLTSLCYDFHVSIVDLPMIFNTSLETIPSQVPYLFADPVRVDRWQGLVEKECFRVGIVWAGSPTHGNDRNRSCDFSFFRPLSNLPNVRLYGLQKGFPLKMIDEAGTFEIDNPAYLCRDFSDTAALIEQMDFVISVDTAVAHLAGAMAKPVWVLLPAVPDWRWMLDRDDSPWYPTARLYRQRTSGDWASVFEQVVEDLSALTG